MNFEIKEPFLYPWQEDVYTAIKEDNGKGLQYCVKASRQKGKSILAIMALLYFAFKNNNSIGVLVEPTMHQCRRVLKQLIKAVGGETSPIIKSSNATLLEIEFVNGSQIVCKSQEQGEAIRGITVKNSILVLDEAAFLEDDTFFILDPTTDATKSPVLIISTPLFCSGQFYERYMSGRKGSDFVRSFDWCDYDTSALLTPEKLAYYEQNMSPLKFKSEILGEFITEGSYIFGNIGSCIRPANQIPEKPATLAGIDWGGGNGGNSTVLTLINEDREVEECLSWKDFDSVDMVDVLADEINSRGLKRVEVEINSLGRTFYDMLKRKLAPGVLKIFTTTNDSKREIIEELIKAFQKGMISIPDDPKLKRQLQHYAMEKTKTGYTYNGADGVEDDYVMSLAFAYDLCPKVDKPHKKPSFGFA